MRDVVENIYSSEVGSFHDHRPHAEGGSIAAIVIEDAQEDFDASRNRRLARELLCARNQRLIFLDDKLFGEPCWDVLLALFVHQHGRRFCASSLCEATNIPPSTLVRTLDRLCEQGLVVRTASPTDLRVSHIELTQSAERSLNRYFHLVGKTLKSPVRSQ